MTTYYICEMRKVKLSKLPIVSIMSCSFKLGMPDSSQRPLKLYLLAKEQMAHPL